jgi:hypothetical protein
MVAYNDGQIVDNSSPSTAAPRQAWGRAEALPPANECRKYKK